MRSQKLNWRCTNEEKVRLPVSLSLPVGSRSSVLETYVDSLPIQSQYHPKYQVPLAKASASCCVLRLLNPNSWTTKLLTCLWGHIQKQRIPLQHLRALQALLTTTQTPYSTTKAFTRYSPLSPAISASKSLSHAVSQYVSEQTLDRSFTVEASSASYP